MVYYQKPIKSDIMLDSKLSIFMSDPSNHHSINSLVFSNFLRKHEFRVVWALKNESQVDEFRKNGIECFLLSDKSEGAPWFEKAKFVFTTYEYDSAFPKREGQVFIALEDHVLAAWEGLPRNDMKHGNVVNATSQDDIDFSIWKSAMTDLIPTSSELTRYLAAGNFRHDIRKIVVTGHPKYDLLINEDGKKNLNLVFSHDFSEYERIIFFAPSILSFIKNKIPISSSIFGFENFDNKRFSKFLSEYNACLVIKYHPYDENLLCRKVQLPNHCYLLSSEDLREKNYTLYHILNAFDLLIGDTSSLINEFMLLDRPVLRYYANQKGILPNIVDAIKIAKLGLDSFEFWYPGPNVFTQDMLESNLQEAFENPQPFVDCQKDVKNLFFKYTDGNSCSRLLKAMESFTTINNYEYQMYAEPFEEKLGILQAAHDEKAYENNRLVCEANRIGSENNRLEIENSRLGNENNRLGSENNRIESENSRLWSANNRLEDKLIAGRQEISRLENEISVNEGSLLKERALLSDTIAQLSHMQQEALNALGHVELLLPVERELAILKKKLFYRVFTFHKRVLFPIGTKRRFIVRLVKVSLRHPILTLKNFRPGKIRNLMRIISNGEFGRANEIVTRKIDTNAPLEANITVMQVHVEANYECFSLPVYREPVVSIIIPAYNEFAYTYACVKSIYDNTVLPYEVIIADDCSMDETKNIGKKINNVIHIRNEENLRFLCNCNNAAKYAKGEYLFFLNNDTQVQPDWLEPLVELMKKDENIGLTGSKLIYPDGRLQEAGGIFWKDGSAWNYGRFENPENPEYNYVKDVDYISGAAIMVRKAIWDKLGGFDERFAPAYCEDADLAFSIRKLGYRTVYQPKSVIVHFEGVSHGTDINAGQKQYQIVNAKKFYEKWKDVLEKDHYPNAENVFYARDRSRYKKSVLFIDHYVPMFDKDAGSRNTFSYVKLFVELGYHVLFLGDNFYSHQPYTEVLQQMGVEVLYGAWHRDNWVRWLDLNGKYINFVYMNRPHISEKYIEAVKKRTTAKIMYHGHDLHYVRLRAQYVVEKDKNLLIEADNWEKIEKKLFSQADVILTVSEKEKEIIQEIVIDKNVLVIPIFFFDSFPNITPFSNRKDMLFVGGVGRLPDIDAVGWFVNEIMPHLPKDIRLIAVGSNPPDRIKALMSDRVIVKGFVSDAELAKLYSSCRVAVIPLRFGAGVKGKTIEAMHNLIPIVATSFGIEGLCEIEEIIPPSDDVEDFVGEINKFLFSDIACENAAKNYEKWIKKWFSTKRAIEVAREMMNEGV